jgi:hypothetical protein
VASQHTHRTALYLAELLNLKEVTLVGDEVTLAGIDEEYISAGYAQDLRQFPDLLDLKDSDEVGWKNIAAALDHEFKKLKRKNPRQKMAQPIISIKLLVTG